MMAAGNAPMDLTLTEAARPAAISDEALVERLRQGEAPAGDELVRRHYPALIRYLHRLTGSQGAADELHQQTWMSVLEHLRRFDASGASGAFRAWLFRIATNKANDLWRQRGRERTAKEGLRLIVEDHAPHAGAAAEGDEAAARLQRAIARLPEAQQQVVLLRYYADMKFVDIARTLGCPLNTALGRMHKAMLKLKETLEQEQ